VGFLIWLHYPVFTPLFLVWMNLLRQDVNWVVVVPTKSLHFGELANSHSSITVGHFFSIGLDKNYL
jgi:hypothetical protein